MEPLNPPLKGLSRAERRDYSYIATLRRTPQFRELVSRLDRLQSVFRVCEWFMSQEARGPMSNCTFGTARLYINSLWKRMKETTKNIPRINLNEFRERAFQANHQTRINAAILNLPEPGPTDFDKIITQEIEKADVIKMLRFCYGVQKERVMQLRQLEKTANMTFQFGNGHLKVLEKIAYDIWRVQAGEAMLRSKNAWPADMGEASRVIDLLPEVKEIAELDPVDQNLIREAFNKTIDLLQQEANLGQYKNRVEAEQRGTEAPEGPSS